MSLFNEWNRELTGTLWIDDPLRQLWPDNIDFTEVEFDTIGTHSHYWGRTTVVIWI